MEEYKLQGLSCANCAREMEEEIQKLNDGEGAKILFNSSKLLISERVAIDKVEKILASDGASIVKEADAEHHHHHENNQKWLYYIGISTLLFVAAMVIESQWNETAAIFFYVAGAALSGYATFMKGLKNLFKLKFNIDTLMTIALIGAFGIGEWKEATLVAILFGLNEYLEGLGMEKARKSMETLLQVAPKEATVISESGEEEVVPINQLREGNLVLVKAGEQIPSDGIVMFGKSSVNEAAITGESMPIEKGEGANVFGGSLNNEGVLKVQITKAYKDSSLAKILHLVEEAQETKTPTEKFINTFAKYYTPLIMVIAAIVMVVPPLFGGVWNEWFYQGLAVLIVGCPCALIISSPIAIISGITRNARHGILIKGGVFLEQLGKIDTIAFDKTGTLTKGEPFVEKMISYNEDEFLPIAGSIENSSSHPLAKAVMKKMAGHDIDLVEPEDIKTIPGQGIQARINGKIYQLGNEESIHPKTLTDRVQKDIDYLKESGYTLIAVSNDDEVLGLFGITDEVRPESKDIIQQLSALGIKKLIMLTGDHHKSAKKVAEQVGLTNYYAHLLPDAKVEKIKEWSESNSVAMIGDGINDAPALATANLGIAMGKGTDSAIETADVVLMQDHLGKLPTGIKVAKRVNTIIKLNITLALGLKIIALLLTIPGLLTLWIAILSDMGATILVTLISLTVLVEKSTFKLSKDLPLQ